MPETIIPVFFTVNRYTRQVGAPSETINAIAEHVLALHGYGVGEPEARALALSAMKMLAAQAVAFRQHRYANAMSSLLLAGARPAATHDPNIHAKAEAEANNSLYWDLCATGETVEKAEADLNKRMDDDRTTLARLEAALATRSDDDEADDAS